MTEMRKDRRAPASLKVKYKSATVDDFIEQFGADVSRGGIFIKTKKPLETGALLKFEFQLQGGAAVIHGVGRVAWRRLEEQARTDLPAGMGIKFIKLDEQSRAVIDRIEARHGAGSRFDQTDAAEFAPPISSLPPGTQLSPPQSPPPAAPHSVAPGARPTPLVPGSVRGGASPANQIEAPPIGKPSVAAALAAARLPKAVSGAKGSSLSGAGVRAQAAKPASIDSRDSRAAALSAPTFRPPPPAALSSVPPALAGGLQGSAPMARPTADRPASVPISAPKGALSGNAPARRSAPATRSAARDASEFLASAFSAGGAGTEVRSQARAQAEQARHDPHSVDLANELFGDLSEPAKKSLPPEAAAEASFGDVLGELDPVTAEPNPRAAEEQSVSEQIPSIEELVNEAAHANPALANAARDEAAARAAAAADADALRSVNPPGLAANDQLPLTLGLPTLPPAGGEVPQPRSSRGLLFGALLLIVLVGAAGAFYKLRGGKTDTALQTAEAPAAPVAAAPQPAAAAPVEAPKPAEPAAPAAAAPISVALSSEPAGADVFVDGKQQGTTPATLSLTPGSEVELSVKSAGFATKTQKLKVEAGTPEQAFKLDPLPYELTIVSEPKGARITAGTHSAESPQPLTLGHLDAPIEVSVEKAGFQRLARTVQLAEFKEDNAVMRAELSLSLTPLPSAAVPARRAMPARAPKPPAPVDNAPPAPAADTPVVQIKPAEEAAPPPAVAAAPEPAPKPAEAAPAPPDPATPPAP